MGDTWLTSLDAESTLRALRRATVFDARWMQSYAGRMVAAAGKAGDMTQAAVWQRIADAASTRLEQLSMVTLVGDESEVRA